MWAQCLKTTKSPPSHLRLSCSSHSDAHHHQIAGFNETVRNWHGEWYFTRSSRGIGIQFSTSNNTTSLNDHWLVYRHCAKLRDWVKVEKAVLPNRQTTTLSPISPLFVCNFSAQLCKCWKKTGINRISAKCKSSKLTWFPFQVQSCKGPNLVRIPGVVPSVMTRPGLSDVEIRLLGNPIFLMQCETIQWLQGLARTQIPTNKNDDVEFPTFGEIAGVNHSWVQWSSLALEEPPSWSWLKPLVQVSMLDWCVFKFAKMWVS